MSDRREEASAGLYGSVWKSKTGMAPITVIGDSSPHEGPGRWILVRGAAGRNRWITVAGLHRKFTRADATVNRSTP